jgi:hypothetical protein
LEDGTKRQLLLGGAAVCQKWRLKKRRRKKRKRRRRGGEEGRRKTEGEMGKSHTGSSAAKWGANAIVGWKGGV